MKKYVAFLDILGFKNKMKKMSQTEAEDFIRDFSQLLYDEWVKDRATATCLIILSPWTNASNQGSGFSELSHTVNGLSST